MKKKWQSIVGSLLSRPGAASVAAEPKRVAPTRVPEGLRVYAIGDVHGRADLLEQAFQAIDYDLLHRPYPRSIEVYLGDYIDRGPDSKAVIDLLLERRARRETACLSGNHEWFMLQFFQSPELLMDWQRHGARETFLSYGVRIPYPLEIHHCAGIAAELRAAIPESHLQFLVSLLLTHRAGDYVFVHAGLRPGLPLESQRAEDLLWIRDEFLDWPGRFEFAVVHGHTPIEEPTLRSDRINIDTGAYLTGRLTCLVLEGGRRGLLR
jgi:serine/threonine protein phosphatase 1